MGSLLPRITLLSIPASSMAAKRMIPPDEPTRALAGATALEKNKNFILLWNKLTEELRSFNREVKHDVYDKWQDKISSSKP